MITVQGRRAARLAFALAAMWAMAARPAGAAEFRWRGLLDLAVPERTDALVDNTWTRGDSPFDAYGLRLFAEGQFSPTVGVFTQFAFNDASQVRADGAYLMWTPDPERDLHVVAGKIPWLIGTWGPRAYSNKNPLIGAPMMYQVHSSLLWYETPPNADALLAVAGHGQTGVDYFGGFGATGMPIVDDAYWDFGVMAEGSVRPIEFAFGAINGVPGWGDPALDENASKSVLGRLGCAPLPGVRIGVSGSHGAYLNEGVSGFLPAGHEVSDYHQTLGMADLEFEAGHGELRGEGYVNVWETPTVGDLRVRGGYLEGKYTLCAGLFAAGRAERMRFANLTDSNGRARPWDLNRDRQEAGIGYRLNPSATFKAVWQRNVASAPVPGGERSVRTLLAAQLSLAFQ